MRKNAMTDPAVVALKRVLVAGDNDAEYDAAIVELETCKATTAQGVRAKRNLERQRREALDEGDRLTDAGRATMQRLADTIDEGLALLTRASMRTRRTDIKPRTTPTPGPGAARQRRKSVERFF